MQKHLQIGAKIYFEEISLVPKEIIELVDKLNISSIDKLNYYRFLKDETAKPTRIKKFDNGEFIKDFEKINFHSISFFDKKISEYSNEEFNIDLTIFPRKTLTVPPHLEAQFKEHSIVNKFVDLTKSTFLKDFIYGFIFVSNIWNKTAMNISLIPISPWKPGQNIFEKTSEERELLFYQTHQNNVSKFIFKAYWGNFLNKNHVEQLGGINKIKKTAPVFLVEELTNGSVYLQLTKSPADFGTKEYEEELRQLDKYFEPIKIMELKK